MGCSPPLVNTGIALLKDSSTAKGLHFPQRAFDFKTVQSRHDVSRCHCSAARLTRVGGTPRVSCRGEIAFRRVGEASVYGFEILPQPSKRLCTQ